MLKSKWYYIFVGWCVAGAVMFAVTGSLFGAIGELALAEVCWWIAEYKSKLEGNGGLENV